MPASRAASRSASAIRRSSTATSRPGFYLQDDIRVRKNLTLSAGVRYEAQTHLNDYNNVGPRVGVTWSPFKSGKTSLRASCGIFYDWLLHDTYSRRCSSTASIRMRSTSSNPAFPRCRTRRRHGCHPTSLPARRRPARWRASMRVSLGSLADDRHAASASGTYLQRRARGANLLVGQQPQRAGERRAARIRRLRQRHRDDRRRPFALALAVDVSQHQPGAVEHAGPTDATAVIMMPGSVDGPKLFDWRRGLYICSIYYARASRRTTPTARSRSGDRQPRRRMGSVVLRHPPSRRT